MNNLFFLLVFLLTGYISLAQNQEPEDSILLKASSGVLEKKFSFSFQGGNLKTALGKINKEQEIKFSYSDNRVENVWVGTQNHANSSFQHILSSLLKNTGLTFLMVGRITVIVPEEKKVADKQISVVPQKKPTGPGIAVSRNYEQDPFFAGQPESVKNKIRSIYASELKWAKSRALEKKNKLTEDSASAKTQKKQRNLLLLSELKFYLKAETGIRKEKLKFSGETSLNWQNDLQWKQTTKVSPAIALGAGIHFRHFYFETGLANYTLSVSGSGQLQSVYTLLEPIGKSGKYRIYQYPYFVPFSTNYKIQVYSVPFTLLYRQDFHNFYVAAGPSIQYQRIKIKGNAYESLSPYYYSKTATPLVLKNNRTSFTGGIIAEAGYQYNKVSVGVSFNIQGRFGPYHSNSLFSVTGSGYTLGLAGRYFFNR